MARPLTSAALAVAAALALSACAPAQQASPARTYASPAPTVSAASTSTETALAAPTVATDPSPSATAGYSGPYSLPQPPVVPGQQPAPAAVPPAPVRQLPELPLSTPSATATTPPPSCAPADAITTTLTAVRMGSGGLVFTLQYKNPSGTAEKLTSPTAYVHDNVVFYQQEVHLLGTAAPTVPARGTTEVDYGYLPGSAAGERSLGIPVSRWTANSWQGGWSSYPCPPITGVENWVSEP